MHPLCRGDGRPQPGHPFVDGCALLDSQREDSLRAHRERIFGGHNGGPIEVTRTATLEPVAEGTRLTAEFEALLDALDRLPQVLSHNDGFHRNVFLKSERLFAVDRAFLGPSPVGAELAPLVTASVAFLGVAHARWRDLGRTAVEAYLRGLQDAG